ATCGIGPNMFLAKVADDKDAKTAKDFLAEWTYDDVPSKLWPITPLNELWGISEGYLKKLNQLGIYKVYDLAHYNKNLLMAKFGVLGEELYEHANGRDDAKIRDKYVPINKGLSLGQVLMRDYTKEEARLIISEMCDELAIRLRKTKLECNTVGLYLRYSLTCGGEGFGKNCSLMRPSNLNSELKQTLLYLYDSNALHKPIRQIGISFTNLSKPSYEQLSLFKNLKADDDERNLYVALDQIMEKYGKNSVLKGTSLTKESTIKERHNQIGGHRK
ncbi:MAG: DNA repair protein, partial [Bacilli bacterium]